VADETPVVNSAPASSEPAAAEPQNAEYEWTGDKSDIERLATEGYEQHQTDKTLQEIASAPEITVAELRKLPGTEGMSDDQLLSMWQKVNEPKGERVRDEAGRFTKAQEKQQEKVDKAVARAWKALSAEGVEVSDLSKMTAEQLLALQFEYNANGKPQRKGFDEIVRNAQLGHYNAERMNQITQERNKSLERARELEGKYGQLEQDKATWLGAMAAAARNEFGPLQTLLNAYMEASNAPAQAPQQQDMISRQQYEAERAGQQVWTNTVLPKAQELADKYGLQRDEVAEGIKLLVEREPQEFFNAQRLQQIMEHDIVYAIEQMRRDHPAAPAGSDPRDVKIAELERKLAERATTHNSHVQQVHQRRKAAPPAPSTMPGNSNVASGDFDSAQGARDWLRQL
jgi:hypothetical protein